MNNLTILESNLELSLNLLNYIVEKSVKIHVTSFAINKEVALNSVESLHKGDIIIVDLDSSDISGLKIINSLKRKRKNMPHIIVLTTKEDVLGKLKGYVHTILKRPVELEQIINVIDNVTKSVNKQTYEKLVKEELSKFDMNVSTIGYTYIVEALISVLEDESLLKDMKNKLYNHISYKHDDANRDNVKWSIEKCVKSTVRYTSSSITKAYFHAEAREHVTPKLFLTTIIDNIKLRLANGTY
jgi:response regulator RpfG family c-di-GMP phosphodiesterase